MRQFFRFQYKLRGNLIFLNYGKNFQKFSYIETLFDKLDESTEIINSPSVSNFLQKVNKHYQDLEAIKKYDFSQQHLQINQTNKLKNMNERFKQKNECIAHLSALSDLTHSFQQMQSETYRNLAQNNLVKSIVTLANYNCIDLKTWQKIVCFVKAYYKKSNLDQRLIFITAISEYLKKFEFSLNSNKKHAFKFMFPQSYMIDLIDFRNFFQAIENADDFIKQIDSEEEEHKKLQILLNTIYLIMKVTKKNDMNIYSVKSFFQKRTQQMVMIASKYKKSDLHKSLLYNIYFIFSYINLNKSQIFERIEKYYIECFKSIMEQKDQFRNPSQKIAKKSKQMNKLLSIWKLNGRSDLQLYNQTIKPYLNFLLDYDLQKNYYNSFSLNLLTAGIQDYSTINKMVKMYNSLTIDPSHRTQGIAEDEIIHMLKHYLNVVHKNSNYESNYGKCHSIQNPKILKYLHDQQVPLFSSCFQYKMDSQNGKGVKKFQHHRVEGIWSEIVKKMFESKCEVIQSAPFCNYQIDFLILSKVGILAIEVQGGHYNKKQINKSSNYDSSDEIGKTGKKQIRSEILKAYGIKIIKIHCQEKIPIYIMQSRNIQIGTKFLTHKLKQETGLTIQEL